jgi:hypothetical protein
LEKKAFDLIAGEVEQALLEQGFSRQKVQMEDSGEDLALYVGEGAAYGVFFDEDKKRFELRTCGMTDEGPDEKWKTISMWLFDPEQDTVREAEGIASDFVETIQGPKRTAVVQAAKKKKKEEDTNVTPLFFMNRLVNVFPELKTSIQIEKEEYEQFRGVTFTREKVLPLFLQLVNQPQVDEARYVKLCNLLSDLYSAGDQDVRSIITMVLLNSVQEPAAERLNGDLTPELQKAWKFAKRFHGKKVKPEKKKKQKKFIADTLNSRGMGR